MRKYQKFALIIVPVLCVLALGFGLLPPVRARLDTWWAQARYALNPPEEAVFVPQEQAEQMDYAVTATLLALAAPTTAVPPVTETPTPATTSPGPSPTPAPSATPTITPTPIPAAHRLKGFNYFHQHGVWNYCAPATLATTLSFWGWEGNRDTTGAYLRGGLARGDDKNVMPYEMQNFVDDETALRMVVRPGGDLDLLKRLIAGGFPVMVEKDDSLEGVGWLGHYLPLKGYDDAAQQFLTLDAYHGDGTLYGYDELYRSWRAFNFTFLVPYPPEREAALFAILGPFVDEEWARQQALNLADEEILTLTGLDQYFAWFNKGSLHINRLEYADAAFAYDYAFSLYAELPEGDRPWRMLWYQTGPYWAYYYTGRYYDVIALADQTLDSMNNPILEESFYWRALAKEAVGDWEGAVEDMQMSVELNENFVPGWSQLQRMLGGG